MFRIIILFLALFIHQAHAQPESLTQEQALKLASDAYVYGYPLVTMEMTRQVMTNVATPEHSRAPMGQFANMRTYPDPSFKDVTTPNADTLYSSAWLDLTQEPYILRIPDEKGRYFLMPMLSGWTDVFSSPGKRTTGTDAQDYAIVGPSWKGTLPKKVTTIKSPTNLVWILGRTYCTGTTADYKAVHQIQNEYQLIPLSSYRKKYTPPLGKIDNSLDMKTPVRDQVNAMNANRYFNLLAMLMKNNPPAKADEAMVKNLAKIGIVPGKPFDINLLSPDVASAFEQAIKVGQAKIRAHEKSLGENRNGWVFSLDVGRYGTDYLQRALVAEIGLGANVPQDAIYPKTSVDSNGKQLNGANNYIIHFAKDQLPPVKGFWSLTMYNDQYFFVQNPINRYSLSPRNNLKMNEDGSVDLLIQHESPGKDKESNWLPAPVDDFVLVFRFYWPEPAIVDGNWMPPKVEMAS